MRDLPSLARGLAGAVIVLVVGYGATALIGLVLGFIAMATEPSFDQPGYAWLVEAHDPESAFTGLMERLTVFGDPIPSIGQTILITVVLMLVFRRRWWIPALVLPLGIAMEFLLQAGIGAILDRAQPPFGSGTYFSGGSARFVVLYGLGLFLVLLTRPSSSGSFRAAGVAVVALLAILMGFTRLYLLMHWPTDVPAGWLMGSLITLTVIIAARQVLASVAPGTNLAPPSGRIEHAAPTRSA